MTCQNAVINCPNTQSMSLAFGEINPANVGLVPQALGTIVILGGDGGVLPGNFGFADNFFRAGYEIVEFAWAGDWEPSYSPFTQGETASIQNAACRSATFLNFVYTTFFANTKNANSHAAYCAHGTSAGSAEVAYSLAYYGAGNWLDYVELLAGPVFSDIKQGCQVPAPSNVTICPTGQYGCQLGSGGSPWSFSPSYLGVAGNVGQWTNDSSCRGSANTTSSSNAAWLAQSIVDQSAGGSGQGALPSFSYPQTGMSAWLCRSVASGYQANNPSPQGQIFYANFSSASQSPKYNVYAVDNCPGAEAVAGGNVPGYQPAIFNGTVLGSSAITDDMVGNAALHITPQCVNRH